MKKIRIILPLLTSTLLLSGCASGGRSIPTPSSSSSSYVPSSTSEGPSSSETPSSEPTSISHNVIPPEAVTPQTESLTLSRLSLGMLLGEEYELKVEVLPHQSEYRGIAFVSSNPDVASVDASGKVKALAKGTTEIVAKSSDGITSRACYVYVGEKFDKFDTGKAQTEAIASKIAEEGLLEKVDTVVRNANFDISELKNGVPQSTSRYFRKSIISRSEAYMYMEDHDTTTKVEDGSESYTNDAWCIYTTESYDTYLFHIDGDTKTYMVADSTTFISKGLSRFDAMCSVLDSLFTNGSSLLTGDLEDCLGQGSSGVNPYNAVQFSDVKFSRFGSKDENNLISTCAANWKEEADQYMEQNYYIPAGTEFAVDLIHDFVVDNKYVKLDVLTQNFSWEIGDDEFVHAETIESEYDAYAEGEFKFFYPDRSDYAKVDTIFDL